MTRTACWRAHRAYTGAQHSSFPSLANRWEWPLCSPRTFLHILRHDHAKHMCSKGRWLAQRTSGERRQCVPTHSQALGNPPSSVSVCGRAMVVLISRQDLTLQPSLPPSLQEFSTIVHLSVNTARVSPTPSQDSLKRKILSDINDRR